MEIQYEMEVISSGVRVHRPLLDRRLTDEDLERARVELNETPEVRERLLNKFREMLASEEKNEKDLLAQTDDNHLLLFLRSRKFDLDRAYNLIRNYYKYRENHPDLFPSSPSDLSDFLTKTNIISYPPYRDHKGRAISHIKIGNWDPDQFPYKDFAAAGIMMADFVMDNPVTQINGLVALWDFKGFSFKQFLSLCSPRNLWILKTLIQDCQPGQYKYGCLVNCHPLVNKTWNLLKALIKEKFKKRMRLLDPGDLEGLYEVFDPCILPPEYGGNLPKWDNQEFVKSLFDNEEYIKYSRSFGYRS